MQNPIRCYSYIRFSTPDQALGHSLSRQMQLSRKYAEKHDFVLDESLSFQDLGVSAFNGIHRTKGALGEFLQCVHSGQIPKGSVLLVESLDRLSREKVLEALSKFIEIIQNDIIVVTLSDGMEYTKESVNDSFSQLLISLTIMSRAHEESLMKSKRLSAAWEYKRNNISQKKLTGRCPAWLELNDDKTEFIKIPNRCNAVKQIFYKKDDGKGTLRITRELNQSDYWKPKNGWRNSYVNKILRNPAVIGEFQPHKTVNGKRQPCGEPITDYFPSIINEKLFYRVQNIFQNNQHQGGRNGKVNNLFSYIAKCGYCGAPMAYQNKGYGERYICDKFRRGYHCVGKLIDYRQFELMILTHTKGLDVGHILREKNQKSVSAINEANNQLESFEGEIKYNKEKIENLLDTIEKTAFPKVQEKCEARLNELVMKNESLEIQQKLLKQNIQDLGSETDDANSEQQVKDLITEMENAEDDRRIEIRLALRRMLRNIYDFIDIYPKGEVVVENYSVEEKVERIHFRHPELPLNIFRHILLIMKSQYTMLCIRMEVI